MKIIRQLDLIWTTAKVASLDRLDTIGNFIFVAIGLIVQTGLFIVFFKALFLHTKEIGGWGINEMIVLLGTYRLLESIAWSTYIRGYAKLPRFIENGELDVLLTKPVNLRFFLCFRHVDMLVTMPMMGLDIALIAYGVLHSSHAVNIWLFLLCITCAAFINFSVISIISTISFFVLFPQTSYLYIEVLKLGRYPITIYKGLTRFFLSFIIPIAFMTTLPARAIFGNIAMQEMVLMITISIIFYFIGRVFWQLGINKYSSANG
jgi:ABC-2 type transport system permease protein